MTTFSSIWAFLNSPIGITLAVGLMGYLAKRFVLVQNLADKYLGTIIQTIKGLEKSIPGGTASVGLERFDRALLLIVDYIEKVEGRDLSPTESIQIANAISVEHAKLEADGNLSQSGLRIADSGRQTVELTAVGEAAAASVAEEEKTGGGGRPTGFGPKVNLNSIIVWFACVGMLVAMAAGCASDNASTLFAKAATSERIVLAAVVAYDQVATATGATIEQKAGVLRTVKVGTDALASLTDSLKSNSDAYQAAKAAGNDAGAAEATSKAKIAFDALNAVATQLLADLQAKSVVTPVSP